MLWLLSALLLGASFVFTFAPYYLGFLTIPLLTLYVLGSRCLLIKPKRPFWRAQFVFFMSFFTTSGSWIYVSIHEFGHAHPIIAGGIVLALMLACTAVSLISLAIFCRYFDVTRQSIWVTVWPFFWLFGEWLREVTMTGFPWLYLGYSQTDTKLGELASEVGTYGVSFICCVVAAFIVWFILWLKTLLASAKKSHLKELGSVSAYMALLVLAWFALQSYTTPLQQKLNTTKIALIQPNIPQSLKWTTNAFNDILRTHYLLTAEALNAGADLIVWPEAAIPRKLHHLTNYFNRIDKMLAQHDAALITGIPLQDTAKRKTFNSVIVRGDGQGVYSKRHLVPFGEYVPFETWLRGAIAFFDLPMSAFTAGADSQVPIQAKGMTFAGAICYEIAYGGIVRENLQNADWILTVSNDAWFGDSLGPHQHFQIAKMRALEHHRPLLRATNNGITGWVDAEGFTETVKRNQAAIQYIEAPLKTGATAYSRFGDWPLVLLGFVMFSLTLLSKRR